MSESILVKLCSDYLSARRIVHWKNHVLNGNFKGFGQKRSYVIKTGLKGLGDMSVPITDGSGVIAMLEFKTKKGRQRQEQKDFEAFCIKNNIPYFIIRSLEDLIEMLEMYEMV